MRYFKSLVLVSLAGACAAPHPESPRADVEPDVVALSRRQYEVIQQGDRAAADALLAPDFHYFSWRALPGRDRDKARELAENSASRIKSFEIHDARTARPTQDSIVLTYLVDLRIEIDGRDLCPHSGAVETWARRQSGWQIVTRTEYLIGVLHPEPCEPATKP